MTAAESPLDARESDLLHQARAGLGPSSQEQAALYAAVAAGAGLPSEDVPEHPVVRPPPSSAPLPRLRSSWLLGSAGGLLVGFGLGLMSARPLDGLLHPAPVRPRAPTAPLGVANATPPSAPPAGVDLIELVPEAPPVLAAPEKKHSAASLPATESAPAATFYDELEHVRRAQAALKNDNPALALGLLTTLGERHPRGALLTERGVIEVLALCKLGQDDRARGVAARVRSSQPGAVYEARLRASCVGSTDASDGKPEKATSTRELEPEDTK